MIAQYESDTRSPKNETVQKIAAALDVPWIELVGEKSIEYIIGKKRAMQIQKEVDALQATQNLLCTLYDRVEEKEVSGLYGETCYYLVGQGASQFILYDGDIAALKDLVLSVIPAMVERIKDTRPETVVIGECREECDNALRDYVKMSVSPDEEEH